MRTQWTITGIVLTAASAAVGVAAALILTLGAHTGTASSVALALVVLGLYLSVVAPWQHRWGATRDEVARPLPGEHLLDATHSTTRAITIEASPEKVWPWLAQIGYGRAGWYSYDWIDNDGKPSATRVLPDLQQPAPDDEIPIDPHMSFTVYEAVPAHHLLRPGRRRQHLVPDALSRRFWNPAGEPVPQHLVVDAGISVLAAHRRSRLLHHGAQDAQEHQAPRRERTRGPGRLTEGTVPCWCAK
jgi:hypothetical protein